MNAVGINDSLTSHFNGWQQNKTPASNAIGMDDYRIEKIWVVPMGLEN
jgi:hypothetical protein